MHKPDTPNNAFARCSQQIQEQNRENNAKI